MKKLRITAYGDGKTGCWMARIKRPLNELEKLGHHVDYLSKGDIAFEKNDIVIFNNLFKLPQNETIDLVAYAKSKNVKIVYDTDDAQDEVPVHNLSHNRAKPLLESFNIMTEAADLITTTTPELAKHLCVKGNKPIKVLPNCLDPKDFPPRMRSKKLRIGFCGSTSHIVDIMLVLPAIRKLQQKYDFEFVVFGFSMNNIDNFRREFKGTSIELYVDDFVKAMKRIKHEWHPWVDVKDYAKKIAALGLDIGLCPLEDNAFNQKKSCIKFYEYALVGTLAVASDVLPYSREPVMKALDWYEALETLINDPQRCEFEAQGQRNWVLQNRDITKMGKVYEELFLNLIKKNGNKSRTSKIICK